jgi:hypothetical protein
MSELDEEFSIEQVKQLPKSQRFRNLEHNMHGTSDYHKVNGEYPTTWARRVMRKYVGKTYEEAFAYYCTLVPDYQQKWFKSEFDLSTTWWRTPSDNFILDENHIIKIKETESKSGPVIFSSYDYKEGHKNRRDGNIVVPKKWWDDQGEMRYVRMFPERYDTVVVSGYSKEFESEKDREYIRLTKEKAKLQKLNKKIEKKEKAKVDYSFISKEEAQRKAEIATDLIKVQKHGFDEESFKGIEYHGQKRKLKTK